MKWGLGIIMIILSVGCSPRVVGYEKVSKSRKIENHLEGRCFEFLLIERSIRGASFLRLDRDQFYFTDGGPFICSGSWSVSSNGKFLILKGTARENEKLMQNYSYANLEYIFKIRNYNTLIWEKHKWIYKQIKNPCE